MASDADYEAACDLVLALPFIGAVKTWRDLIGVSLTEARSAVTRIAQDNRQSPLGRSYHGLGSLV